MWAGEAVLVLIMSLSTPVSSIKGLRTIAKAT